MAGSEPLDIGAIAERLRERLRSSPFHRWVGMEAVRVEPGEVDLAFEIRDEHRNLSGLLHGGLVATVADTAMGLAFRTTLPDGRSHVTSQLNVHFLEPATTGRIIAKGRVVRSGARVGVTEATVLDDRGRLLARASATLVVVREAPG